VVEGVERLKPRESIIVRTFKNGGDNSNSKTARETTEEEEEEEAVPFNSSLLLSFSSRFCPESGYITSLRSSFIVVVSFEATHDISYPKQVSTPINEGNDLLCNRL
jgi:hypothetical protein